MLEKITTAPKEEAGKQHHPKGGEHRNTTQKGWVELSTAQKQEVGKKHHSKGGGWAGQRHSKEGGRSIPPNKKKEPQHHPRELHVWQFAQDMTWHS